MKIDCAPLTQQQFYCKAYFTISGLLYKYKKEVSHYADKIKFRPFGQFWAFNLTVLCHTKSGGGGWVGLQVSAVALFLISSEKRASKVDNVIGLCIYTVHPTYIVVTQG